jgi:hypothetical protein
VGVRARPKGTFYSELRASGFWLTLGTYDKLELAARAYDAAVWRLGRPRRDLNFPDVASHVKVEFFVPLPALSPTRTVAVTATCSAAPSSLSATSA